MAVYNETNLQNLSEDAFLRIDVDYINIKKEFTQNKVFNKFKEFMTFLETGKSITKADYAEGESEYAHVVVRNIKNGEYFEENMVYLNDEKGEELEEYRLNKGDIVIAISSNVGASFYYAGESELNLTLSHYLTRCRVNKNYIDPRFFVYYLNSGLIKKYFRAVETGKTQKNLSKYYIKNLPILFNPDISVQKEIMNQIIPIENEIKELKILLKDPLEAINTVFAREFNYDPELWKKFGKGMTVLTQKCESVGLKTFNLDFINLENSNILRFSTRYHNEYAGQLLELLKSIGSIPVKEIITKPIKRGRQPVNSPDGEICVIKTGQLKNKCVDLSGCTMVTEEFYEGSERARVFSGDVLIASTGKGSLGKVDIVESDEKLVVDGHISILSIDNTKYNPLFFIFYMRSILGGFQFERDYTGATNQIELYANEIHEFLVPNIEIEKQCRIVNEIKQKLNENKLIEKHIEEKCAKIEEIIKNVILN
ncbi:hypothetical protein [Methanococcus maripaludis]|uniref:Type I restriction enzyme S subunit n=1 Tax=Methanococcus maripaludis TaxID=39152 RepID=A0A7J9SF67_METMI|nr:hypothetical protein [Methanococcus maripaludis]MBB6497790.1 type I restriction enzyme S subunit [Methanococcus maripaludis]